MENSGWQYHVNIWSCNIVLLFLSDKTQKFDIHLEFRWVTQRPQRPYAFKTIVNSNSRLTHWTPKNDGQVNFHHLGWPLLQGLILTIAAIILNRYCPLWVLFWIFLWVGLSVKIKVNTLCEHNILSCKEIIANKFHYPAAAAAAQM